MDGQSAGFALAFLLMGVLIVVGVITVPPLILPPAPPGPIHKGEFRAFTADDGTVRLTYQVGLVRHEISEDVRVVISVSRKGGEVLIPP